MKQEQEKRQADVEVSKNNFQEKFDAIQKKAETRVVTLSYKSRCGCGRDYKDERVTVKADSDWQDGDIFDDWNHPDFIN